MFLEWLHAYFIPLYFAQVVQAQDLLNNASDAYYVWGAVTIASWGIIALLFKLYKEGNDKKQELLTQSYESRITEYQSRLSAKQALLAEKEKIERELRDTHEKQIRALYEQMQTLMHSQHKDYSEVIKAVIPLLETLEKRGKG